jgi:serralysin
LHDSLQQLAWVISGKTTAGGTLIQQGDNMKANKDTESVLSNHVSLDANVSRNEVIIGDNYGNDLSGGDGNDIIYGGGGQDTLKGGKGHDTFLYLDKSESTLKSPDKILDFETGIDQIDLSALKIKSTEEIYLSYDEKDNSTELVLNPDLNCFPGFRIIIVGHVDLATDIII